MLGLLLVVYRGQITSGLTSSRSFVSDLFKQQDTFDVKVNSSHGFNFSYDEKQFYASGIDTDTGKLHIGSELAQQRPYDVVRIAPNYAENSTRPSAASALTLTYHPGGVKNTSSLDTLALSDGGINVDNLTRMTTSPASIGGTRFQKVTWQSKSAGPLASTLSAKFVTYAGTVRGDAVTIVISLGVSKSTESTYQNILDSILFNTKVSAVKTPTSSVVAKAKQSRSLLDTLTNTQVAAAANGTAGVDLTGSEKVAALYSPAVVKIYNAYCMDIKIDGKAYINDTCSATSGSGFFLSQDGYVGTNGHVATATPLDIVITDALSYYSSKGDPQYFQVLLKMTGLKDSDIPSSASDEEILGIMIDAMYKISPNRVTASNEVQNLLVQVTSKNPDIATLLQDTKNRKEYDDASVLPAKLKASDYRANDGYDGFKASDVAILKVEGENFPIVKLGGIDSVTQGADLSILGYPGNASDNGIVDSTSSEATLTTGKVSSKKNAENSDKRLIETDTTIGHGNSGGPALDDEGDVVGIATYTADGSGDGDGTYNYIRDIKDLTDLAADNSIRFDTDSQTQAEWETGIAYFYSSHYSKALTHFKNVKELYPNNSRVDEFIAAAEKRIANGEDVVDFPFVPVLIAAGIVLFGVSLGIFLVVRHHKKHAIYRTGMQQGTVLPAGPGVGTQRVFVSNQNGSGMTVETPLILSSAPVGAVQQQSEQPQAPEQSVQEQVPVSVPVPPQNNGTSAPQPVPPAPTQPHVPVPPAPDQPKDDQ